MVSFGFQIYPSVGLYIQSTRTGYDYLNFEAVPFRGALLPVSSRTGPRTSNTSQVSRPVRGFFLPRHQRDQA